MQCHINMLIVCCQVLFLVMPSLRGLGSSSDDADTLPQDIRTVPVPHDKSPEWTSPELSAKTRRSKYQGVKTAEEEKESLEKVENKKNDGVLAHKQEPSQKVIEKKKEEATDKATESDAEARQDWVLGCYVFIISSLIEKMIDINFVHIGCCCRRRILCEERTN